MSRRSFKHILRNPDVLFLSIGLPVVLMLMFVFVFGGAINTGTDYINYVVPGVIITCVGYASSMTAGSVAQDIVGGLFERFRSMPIRPSSLLVGHVIGSFVRNAIGAIIVFVVALLIGFRPNAEFWDWFGVVGYLSLFLFAISWVAVVLGLIAKSVEAASAFTFFIIFLPYISSAFVPTETMPKWLHPFAEHQPLTPLIETLRGFLTGTPIGNSAYLTLLWFGSLMILSIIIATIVFKRKKAE
ncbi:ABC transporter permease [Ferdinandcohnia quinoae]|uniref:Transport permease protein n=1 Tax=Fredinandcohnia quinoae TaxID=2918902 RepID=A0AAW5E6Q7_9BACI|nr:ABC transporter permease [Fredinandcohnia sp. SECRCQ15]MCH1627179.1 ABC transporter permease [Fredinandcohnia sp. SECRCQ15]